MWGKSFDQDKNYILKEAQINCKENLLKGAVTIALENYQILHNPLGLQDKFITSLKAQQDIRYSFLESSYFLLADIYRLTFSSNQLEILWDGKSHYDKYCLEWSRQFMEWQNMLGKENPEYSRIIIKGCMLNDKQSEKLLSAPFEKLVLSKFGIERSRKGWISFAA